MHIILFLALHSRWHLEVKIALFCLKAALFFPRQFSISFTRFQLLYAGKTDSAHRSCWHLVMKFVCFESGLSLYSNVVFSSSFSISLRAICCSILSETYSASFWVPCKTISEIHLLLTWSLTEESLTHTLLSFGCFKSHFIYTCCH